MVRMWHLTVAIASSYARIRIARSGKATYGALLTSTTIQANASSRLGLRARLRANHKYSSFRMLHHSPRCTAVRSVTHRIDRYRR